MDVADATRATFAPHVGTTFSARARDGEGAEHAVPLVLREAAPGPGGGDGRPFTLLLHGPADRPLVQATWELEHEALGRLALFLVPLGPTDYEAVFA